MEVKSSFTFAAAAAPANFTFRFANSKTNDLIFSIHPDGRVELCEGATMDDAAKAFWDYMISVDPRGRNPTPSDHVETLYRWRGPRGGWIYDERKPKGWPSERLEVRAAVGGLDR